ncbi:MAG: selenide, water dikinase SelD [Bacteroidales bacterium]|nr:selenide, water dikinase SelD [Bacteroidales bacterium]
MSEIIYLDYNATTPIDREVVETMKPFLEQHFGNPSSIHNYGMVAKKAVMTARQQVAALLNCKPHEIIFTSGGTESNNLAIKGIAEALQHKGNHIITTSVEHPAVTEVCQYLSGKGFEITFLPVDEFGRVEPEEVKKAVKPTTILITVMHANNEVGTIQPVREIAEIAREHSILMHTDAAQSIGKIEVDVQKMHVDLLSVAGHKLYAPKGIGALYIREGITLQKLIHGADHEMNLRAGTENVLEIVGLGKACEVAKRDLEKNIIHLKSMTDLLYETLKKDLPEIKVNGHPTERLPNTLSISFPGIEANTLLGDMNGVAASAGAACHTDKIDISIVLKAMHVSGNYAMGTIRFSTGKYTTISEIKSASEIIIKAVNKLKGGNGQDHILPETVRLTQFTHGLGCACKIRPQYLEEILKDFQMPDDPNVLVSLNSSDDAAVYKISENMAIVQTVDFFTPVVDDPYQFGAIATANALSDIYAMGAKPVFALNIVAFPDKRLPVEVLKAILKGAKDKAKEAGVLILGGHTIEDTEPKFGMAVTGFAHPDEILTNSGMQQGDALILTKPLGLGIITTAMKQGLVSEKIIKEAISVMSELNKTAAEVMSHYPVNACTDVTGFGLLGHLKEMTESSKADVELYASRVPVIEGTEEFVAGNLIPGGTKNNLEFILNMVDWGKFNSELTKFILSDAQTSGGLLIALPEEHAGKLLADLQQNGILHAALIGRCVNKGVGKIVLQE